MSPRLLGAGLDSFTISAMCFPLVRAIQVFWHVCVLPFCFGFFFHPHACATCAHVARSCMHVAHVLHACCTHVAQMLPAQCTHFAHMLHRCCLRVAPMLHACCLHVAHVLHACYIHAARTLHMCCVHVTRTLHACCTHIAYMVHTCFTRVATMLHAHCTPITLCRWHMCLSACVHVYIQVECIAAILVGRMHSYVNLSSISASFHAC